MEWILNIIHYVIPFLVLLGVLVLYMNSAILSLPVPWGSASALFPSGLAKNYGAARTKKVPYGKSQQYR